jgi:ubiquinone/menaquinone biosynthesis C-methylase UbiE
MTEIIDEKVKAGISLYTRPFLFVYDWFALGYGCHRLWNCPSQHILELYNKHVTANHLDIGVGTGYFMDKCRFPSPRPRLVLMDLNLNSLNMAKKRLARYNPKVYQRNALEPFDTDEATFDSVGIVHLLHCLPGNMETKSVVFKSVLEVLNPGGVLFGSTIMPSRVKKNWLSDFTLKRVNQRGIMTNLDDTVEDLKEQLNRYFSESSVTVIGYVALFRARK